MIGKDGRRDNMEQPLQGAVLCCTSIPPEQRTHMAEAAIQMGAEHRFDLTSDVTHLIVGDSNTPKYKYVAREREDIKTMQLEWIEAIRRAWMQGDDVNLQALEVEYRLPTFAGLRICVTGFENLSFRAQLQNHIVENGGDYRGDLTKEITHLIAFNAEGKKYQFATQWDIRVVGLKWLKDSLLRRMVLDESFYHPSMSRDQQGVGAWKRQTQPDLQLGKHNRTEDLESDLPRKLRRTASAKLGSQSDSLWGEIISEPQGDQLGKPTSHRPSRIASFVNATLLESKSFATDTTTVDDVSRMQPSKSFVAPAPLSKPGMFSSISFLLYGFSSRQASILREHLASNQSESVEIVTDQVGIPASYPSSSSSFLIVPHDLNAADLLAIEDASKRLELVTDMWAERCLLSKCFFHPDEHVLSRPIRLFPIPGFEKLTINTTGLADVDLLHVCKMVKLLGAKFDQVLKPGISLLLCNIDTAGGEKLRHAREWRIPSVSTDWLWSCIRSGQLEPTRPFLHQSFREHQIHQDSVPQLGDTASERRDGGALVQVRRQPVGKTYRTAQSSNKHASNTSVATEGGAQASKVVHEEGFLEGPSSNHIDRMAQAEAMAEKNGPQIAGNRHARQENGHRKAEEGLGGRLSEETSIDPAAESEETLALKSPPPGRLDGQAGVPEDKQNGNSRNESDTIPAVKASHKSPRPSAITGAIKELLDKNKSNKTNPVVPNGRRTKRRLLGGALSNLSNSSREGSTLGISRASSIDSVNTDGLGSVILDDIPQPRKTHNASVTRRGSFMGRASVQNRQCQKQSSELCDAALYREEYPEDEEPPQMTQLGYENPDDAVALREMLAERRRNRTGKTVQDSKPTESREDKKIKDDATSVPTGRNGGRKLRQRAISP